MSKSISEKINSLSKERKEKILQRAAVLIEEELSLREIRTMRQKTQEKMAELLKKRQDEISRFENREDFLLSTLSAYIEALGGRLILMATFDDSAPVILNNHFRRKKIL